MRRPSETEGKNHPAVIVGGGVSALGIARSLAPSRTRVIVADTTRLNAALWSRHCESRVLSETSGEGLISALKSIGRELDRPGVLFLTQDRSVETVSKFRDQLKPYFRFLLPSEETVDLLADKGRFHEFASREGYPIPIGAVVTAASGTSVLDGFVTPVIVKPVQKNALRSRDLEPARRFDSLDEAKAHCARLLNHDADAIVQQWVDGPDDSIYFCLFYCDDNGQPIRIFTGRKLSAFPPQVGSTATCVAAPDEHAELTAITVKLTTHMQFAGMGGVEFKRDARTGQFFIIEPTVGRADWQEEIATLSGFNIPLANYLHSTSQPVPKADFVRSLVAWRTSLKHRKPSRLKRTGYRLVDGYWRSADPVPGLIFYGVEPIRRFVDRSITELRKSQLRWRFNRAREWLVGS